MKLLKSDLEVNLNLFLFGILVFPLPLRRPLEDLLEGLEAHLLGDRPAKGYRARVRRVAGLHSSRHCKKELNENTKNSGQTNGLEIIWRCLYICSFLS
jgi:hypothetical protein